jgi:hypothetical protein
MKGDVEANDRGLILRYYPRICLEGLRNPTINLSKYNRAPGGDLNPRPPEYEARVLATRLRRSFSEV